jgi:anti-sigma regulatory factor (Ser/Thr protein kinase)
MKELEFIKKLLGFAELRSDKVPSQIAKLLTDYYSLRACAFYSFEGKSPDDLVLFGQFGFAEQAYEKIHLPYHNSIAGRCLQKQSALIITDSSFKLEPLIKNAGACVNSIKALIAIPLTAEAVITSLNIGKHPYYGVLYLYLPEQDLNKLEAIKNSFNELAYFVSDVYLRSVVHDRILLRQEIIERAVTAKDLNSFLYKTLCILKNWGIEAASVYMLDERTQTLRLSSTTGLVEKKRKENILIGLRKRPSIKNCVLECFDAANIVLYSEMTGESESITLPFEAVMAIPIFHPTQEIMVDNRKSRRVIGVLKCVNRVISHGNSKNSCRFGFADQDRMYLIAEIIGIIAILYWRIMHIHEDFERTVHGVLNNVVSMRASLSNLDRHGSLDNYLKANKNRYYYAIPDSLSNLDALKWQIEKFSNRDRKTEIKIARIFIRDVINESLQIAKPLAHYFNIDLELKIDDKKLIAPPVAADSALLVTVFRNLIENCIKYANQDSKCIISIYWQGDEKAITVYVEDNGIGIDEEDKELIFVEGYRTEEAIRHVTSGASAGLGLFQCRAIMGEMHGNIELYHHRQPTIFKITLPKG